MPDDERKPGRAPIVIKRYLCPCGCTIPEHVDPGTTFAPRGGCQTCRKCSRTPAEARIAAGLPPTT